MKRRVCIAPRPPHEVVANIKHDLGTYVDCVNDRLFGTGRLVSVLLISVFLFLPVANAQEPNTPESALSIPMDTDWTIDPASPEVGVNGKNLHPSVCVESDGSTYLSFQFPRSPLSDPYATGTRYGYMVHPVSRPISGSHLVMVIREVLKKGQPEFNSDDPLTDPRCHASARVRFFIQRGRTLYGGSEWYRLYSNPVSYDLSTVLEHSGEYVTLTAPIDPSQWSNVNGHFGSQNPSEFWATINNPGYIGIVFGGCFFGHGVNVSHGKVKFQVYQLYSY